MRKAWLTVISFLFIVCMNFSTMLRGQNNETSVADSGNQELEVTTAGEVRLLSGRRGALRVYTAADGNKGTLTYGQFQTVGDARKQIDEWMKLALRITRRKRTKDEKGVVVEERILAIAKYAHNRGDEFLIIRRFNVDCYLIESRSLAVALQVEQLTK